MIRRYLATLHTKPDHHKKRFSLVVSGCFTLLIFSIWSTVKFGGATSSTVAETPTPDYVASSEVPAVSPFDSLKASVNQGWQLIQGEFGKAKSGLQSVDIQNNYQEVRNDALNQTPSVNSLNNQYGQ